MITFAKTGRTLRVIPIRLLHIELVIFATSTPIYPTMMAVTIQAVVEGGRRRVDMEEREQMQGGRGAECSRLRRRWGHISPIRRVDIHQPVQSSKNCIEEEAVASKEGRKLYRTPPEPLQSIALAVASGPFLRGDSRVMTWADGERHCGA